jgi:hypothetical protein
VRNDAESAGFVGLLERVKFAGAGALGFLLELVFGTGVYGGME